MRVPNSQTHKSLGLSGGHTWPKEEEIDLLSNKNEVLILYDEKTSQDVLYNNMFIITNVIHLKLIR